jgi:ComF family protein
MTGMMARSLNELSNSPRGKFDSVLARGVSALRRMLERGLPQTCALCAARSGDSPLCSECMNALPELGPACPLCASPAPTASICGACLKRPPRLSSTIAAGAYAYPLDRLVQALKYEHKLSLAQPLGHRLAAAIERSPSVIKRPDAVIALPLAPARQRERGFNQAIEIARVVARRTTVPLTSGLVRTGNGAAQASLPWAQRRRNVRGAFACTRSFSGRHVAIVDDVMTTGATLEAAATALLQAGASRVDAWVVARTLPPSG